MAKSHRTPNDKVLIRWDKKIAKIDDRVKEIKLYHDLRKKSVYNADIPTSEDRVS